MDIQKFLGAGWPRPVSESWPSASLNPDCPRRTVVRLHCVRGQRGAGAVVWNYPSSRDAQQAAIQYCGWTSCEALNYFTDCGVAVRNDTHVQAAHGRTLGAATRAALNAIPGGGGYIDLWACN